MLHILSVLPRHICYHSLETSDISLFPSTCFDITSLDERRRVPFIIAVTGLVFCCDKSAMPYLRHLVHGLSLQSPGFNVRAVHVGFMVGRVSLGQSFPRSRKFSLAAVMHPVLCNHTVFICCLSHITSS
jgi:hypothetical protein